jgi:SAM-dependent methyltransferase
VLKMTEMQEPVPSKDEQDHFGATCDVCGEHGRFERDRVAIRESFRCQACRSVLRYQGQARAIVRHFARNGISSFAALCEDADFRDLKIWEPGELGPLRRYLGGLPGYETSSYLPDVPPGTVHDGVRCENLMALTYPSESFDLVITSDVFEHVRHPYVGFAEVYRVLRPGGVHVFSVPGTWPLRDETTVMVDTSGDEDILLMEPEYHRHHLVYNKFGSDMLYGLAAIGFETEAERFDSDNRAAARLVTFCSVKPKTAP